MLSPPKMTGIEVDRTNKSSSSSDDMLTTPKLPDSATPGHTIFSPRFSAPPSDVLTTPVLSAAEYWSNRQAFPAYPENLSLSSPGPRDPPKDLPMDSNIGLRSPCDGLLHKRRMYKLHKLHSSNSVNSDSNSCDTPTSENSPRDLTTGPPKDESEAVSSPRQPEEPPAEPKRSPIRLPPKKSPNSFKHPSCKPENLRLKDDSSAPLPSHYQPSPLAVPSPNWSAVERNFGPDMLKTPKLLDNTVFDFLCPPTTPRSKLAASVASSRDRSPGAEIDRYLGRDQRLSPRLSPRFPIPETPTDLSSKGDRRPPPYPSEAEDLSMGGTKQSKAPPPAPPPAVQIHHQQLKQEFPPELIQNRQLEPDPDRPRSAIDIVKPEVPEEYEPYRSSSSSYGFFHPFHPFHSFYQRQMAGYPPELPRPPPTSSPCLPPLVNRLPLPHSAPSTPPPTSHGGLGSVLEMYDNHPSGTSYASQGMWGDGMGHASHHAVHPPPWTTPPDGMDDDRSVSPPPMYKPQIPLISVKPPSALISEAKKARKEMNGELETAAQKRRKQGKKGGAAANKDPNGTKRVFVCPHCQRSYDWNYNLNRHLKYECGKENKFQCSKCGRKFPHKQNCVYHLKRKHKIVCDSIDQYVSGGLVIFRPATSGGSTDGGPTSSQPVVKSEDPYGQQN